jgi:hypothetical protein
MTVAERNRRIKQTLIAHYGTGNVRVRGDRGTAYGWVDVRITHKLTPTEDLAANPYAMSDAARAEEAQVWQLLDQAGLARAIGTYGYDDPGSDYGYGRRITVRFEAPAL